MQFLWYWRLCRPSPDPVPPTPVIALARAALSCWTQTPPLSSVGPRPRRGSLLKAPPTWPRPRPRCRRGRRSRAPSRHFAPGPAAWGPALSSFGSGSCGRPGLGSRQVSGREPATVVARRRQAGPGAQVQGQGLGEGAGRVPPSRSGSVGVRGPGARPVRLVRNLRPRAESAVREPASVARKRCFLPLPAL